MSGITHVLDIATRALMAEQLGLEVTSHNVTNVNTPGYSRQKVNFETSYPLPSPWGPLGDGVKVQGMERAFDPFITARLNEKTSSLAEYEARTTYLDRVVSLFNETQEGFLNDRLSEFWAAWHDLADNPTGMGERQALVQQGLSLSETFNYQADMLVQERLSLTQQLSPLLDEINAHASRIAQLNRDIQAMEASGQLANDLRDQRQLELNKLSELIGIRYYTSSDGMINVTLASGTSLVQGVASWTLDYQVTPGDTIAIIWQGPGGLQEDITGFLYGGKLTALIKTRDELIPQFQANLDDIARELIAAVNLQHSQGVGLELFATTTGTYAVDDPGLALNAAGLAFGDRIAAGSFEIHVERDGTHMATGTILVNPGMTLTDLINAINTNPDIGAYVTASVDNNRLKISANLATDSFGFARDDSQILMALGVNTFFTGDKAYTLDLNPWVLGTPEFIAAGQIEATGDHGLGDNRNALALADLENDLVGPNNLTFAEAYRRLVTDIGLEAEQAGQEANFYQMLVEQFTQMRDAVSGVSLDEELSNLIKFQRAYQAAARLISVADELYQTLLALKK